MIITGMDHFQSVCKRKMVDWYNKSDNPHKGSNDVRPIDLSNVFVVWSCKTLQNYKCLVSTTVSGTVSMQNTRTTETNRNCMKMSTRN